MNSNTKAFTFVILFVVLIAGGMIYFVSRSKGGDYNKTAQNSDGKVAGASTQDEKTYDQSYIEKLAKFMTEKGMVLYGAYWCPHCQDQKKLFGDAIKYIDYVECDAEGENPNPDECVAQGIEGYPTWIYQGKKMSGYKTLAELAKTVNFTDSTKTDTPPADESAPPATE